MKRFFGVVVFLVLISGLLMAQEQEVKNVEVKKVDVIAETSPSGAITFSFKEADIRNVMRLIATKAGVNIVYGPEVTGVVNMELHDVPWEQALDLVLDLNGYAYQQKGNVIKVLSKDAVSKEPLSTKVFVLNYATASEIAPALQQILTERGNVKTDVRSNTVIVTDVPANINKIEVVLAKLDSRTPQVLIEAKIIEMKDTMEKDLGIKWTSLKEYALKFQDPTRTYKSIRRGGQGMWDEDSIKVKSDGDGSVDTITTSSNDASTSDINYTETDGTRSSVVDTVHMDDDSGLLKSFADTFTRTLLKSDIRSAVLSADTFELILSALESETDVELLSSPRIVTANNESAEIKIIDEYPVPDYAFDTETSSWSITGFKKEEIGVLFNVTPNISADGYVTIKIEPKISKLLGTIPFTAGGATVNIPFIAVKKATTKLVLKSGDTIAVGGLIDEDKANVVTKIPILGDIPVLGRLFRHDDIGKSKKDVIFFITATIITEDSDSFVRNAIISQEKSSKIVYSEVFPDIAKKNNMERKIVAGNKGYLVKNTK